MFISSSHAILGASLLSTERRLKQSAGLGAGVKHQKYNVDKIRCFGRRLSLESIKQTNQNQTKTKQKPPQLYTSLPSSTNFITNAVLKSPFDTQDN